MNFKVSILGSGAAIPLLSRNPSAQLVNVNEHLYLLDCAEGTQLQLRRQHVRIQRIEHIFISHLHGDHYYGLMGLVTTFHLLGRKETLHVYAHPDLEKIINLHLNTSKTVLQYPLVFHGIDPYETQMIHEDKFVTVTTIPLEHNFPACGFLIREKQAKRNIRKDFLEGRSLSPVDYRRIKNGEDYVDEYGGIHLNYEITLPPREPRAYAYCSDTAYSEDIIPVIKGVNLLYHESTFMEDRAADAATKYHSTAKQAALIALKAGAGRLIIGHYSARYKTLDNMLAEAKEVFTDTVLAEDGLIIEL